MSKPQQNPSDFFNELYDLETQAGGLLTKSPKKQKPKKTT